MRISWRIFCVTYVVVFVAIATVGYALVEKNNSYVWNETKDEALAANEMAGQLFVLLYEQEKYSKTYFSYIERQIANITLRNSRDKLVIFDKKRITNGILSDTSNDTRDKEFMNISNGQQKWRIVTEKNDNKEDKYLQIVCALDSGEDSYYVQTLWDLNDIYNQKDSLIEFYGMAVLIGSFICGVILFVISHFIAVPIRQLSKRVNDFAAGDYSKNKKAKFRFTGIEVLELSDNFNRMADTIIDKVEALNDAVERREQFIADFTHELKTPMTAIIGYADLLRSYGLDEEERSQAASTIYHEGKRLESLSMKLLELFVMQKEVFDLKCIDMKSYFEELELSLRFLSEKYDVDIVFFTEEMKVMAEPELLHSLFYNIIDNACKASWKGQKVEVMALLENDMCKISITDYGRGIKKKHISEVTEPFYMEDKSRSRKQGGAGLGLALCKESARIHGTELVIESEQGMGTVVRFTLQIARGNK